MHFRIVELTPVLYESMTATAISLVARDFESYESAKLALLAYEAESAWNSDWAVYAILAMTSDFPL